MMALSRTIEELPISIKTSLDCWEERDCSVKFYLSCRDSECAILLGTTGGEG